MHSQPLWEMYSDYVKLSGAEISLKASDFLCDQISALGKQNSELTLVDLGSGWSSFLYRQRFPGARIVSVDENVGWLEKTVQFCEKWKQNNGLFVTLDDFKRDLASEMKGNVDVVLHDLHRALRIPEMPLALDMVKSGGFVYLDDMHKRDIREFAEKYVPSRTGFVLEQTREETYDDLTRYGWIARRVS